MNVSSLSPLPIVLMNVNEPAKFQREDRGTSICRGRAVDDRPAPTNATAPTCEPHESRIKKSHLGCASPEGRSEPGTSFGTCPEALRVRIVQAALPHRNALARLSRSLRWQRLKQTITNVSGGPGRRRGARARSGSGGGGPGGARRADGCGRHGDARRSMDTPAPLAAPPACAAAFN
ncbi:hypothetical protein EVAR_3198_1 [Eumeta japonica]|uniref:Uncharacterized protein n=1 Tax=Eumeta variegata TaxID=151549 RepID=A0A4C1SUJ9_EUMVA|nr:hypothetical protein EVAR_3198_1 [Eumeta japonica]